jgi:hypothetical protein
MANAKPSRPGTKKVDVGPQGEVNIPVGSKIVRKADGTVVARTEYNSGNVLERNLFPEDHKGVEAEDEE